MRYLFLLLLLSLGVLLWAAFAIARHIRGAAGRAIHAPLVSEDEVAAAADGEHGGP
jgi:ABC-type branched-subunit amino acid transport system permease subunit